MLDVIREQHSSCLIFSDIPFEKFISKLFNLSFRTTLVLILLWLHQQVMKTVDIFKM